MRNGYDLCNWYKIAFKLTYTKDSQNHLPKAIALTGYLETIELRKQ